MPMGLVQELGLVVVVTDRYAEPCGASGELRASSPRATMPGFIAYVNYYIQS
jgi:hypothetical protein